MAQPNTDVSPAWVHEVSGMFRTECSRKKGWKMHTAWFPAIFATKGLHPMKERSVKSTFCHAVFSLIDDLGQDWMVHRFEPSKMMQCCWRADVNGTCLRNKRSGCVLQITVWGQGIRGSGQDKKTSRVACYSPLTSLSELFEREYLLLFKIFLGS